MKRGMPIAGLLSEFNTINNSDILPSPKDENDKVSGITARLGGTWTER
jgi:hypothetical protein